MKVILNQDVKALGKKGDLVEVNDGYAKNFLIPKKLCVEATASATNEYHQKKAKEERRIAEEFAAAVELYKKLNNGKVQIEVKTHDGKMHGSITAQHVSDNLAKDGYTVDKKKITVLQPIKVLGEHDAEIWCAKGYIAKIKVSVVEQK